MTIGTVAAKPVKQPKPLRAQATPNCQCGERRFLVAPRM